MINSVVFREMRGSEIGFHSDIVHPSMRIAINDKYFLQFIALLMKKSENKPRKHVIFEVISN